MGRAGFVGLGVSALLAVALSACGGGGAGGEGAKVPNAAVKIPLEVWDYTLPNGMRVILDEDKAAPVVAVNVWYKVGSKDDPPGRAGFAHLFEHLMFQGTHSIEGDVFAPMQAAGATKINASTNLDRTEYHETVPRGALEWFLWFEAERLATMGERLDQETFERERRVVKNELRQNYENRELGFLYGIKLRAAYGKDHPYGHPTIGSLEELDAATLQEVSAFHAKFYQPSNAVLSLVGDFDHKQVSAWIAKYFGNIPNAPVKPTRAAAPLKLVGERRVTVEADVPFPRVDITYPAPPEGSPALAPLVAVSLRLTGLLDALLVDERKYARDVEIDVRRGMLGSLIDFSVKLQKDGDYDEVVRVFDYILGEPPTRFGSVNASLNRMKLDRIFDFEDFAERAEMYAHHDDLKGNPLFLARELEAIHSMGRADAFEARDQFLKNKNRLITIVKRSKAAPLGGRVVEGG